MFTTALRGGSRNFRRGGSKLIQGSKLIADSAMLDKQCRDREASHGAARLVSTYTHIRCTLSRSATVL